MPTVAGQTTTWNVFHYTDLNALINIVHKDCIVLRAQMYCTKMTLMK